MERRTTIDIIMKKEMAEELEQRAESMHLSVSNYIELVLMGRLHSEKSLSLVEK